MAKQQRDPGREQYWRELVTQWQASGLSVREFCSQRQVKEASFYSWRRELQQRDASEATKSTFVPVRVVATTATIEVRCPSGHVVAVTNADRDTLRQLFAALSPESPC
jgi:transposase-like protein